MWATFAALPPVANPVRGLVAEAFAPLDGGYARRVDEQDRRRLRLAQVN